MTGLVDELLARLTAEDAVLVRVTATQGTAPREAGTWMAVWADGLTATIGGGQLEFQATDIARDILLSDARTTIPRGRSSRQNTMYPRWGACGSRHPRYSRESHSVSCRPGNGIFPMSSGAALTIEERISSAVSGFMLSFAGSRIDFLG